MRHDDLLWISERTEALISRHVRCRCAECETPKNAIAAITFVAEVACMAHFGNVLCDHRLVTAKAAGGQHDGAATDILDHTARALDLQADDSIVFVGIQRGDRRFGDHFCARACTGVEQQCEQFFTVAPGWYVQATR